MICRKIDKKIHRNEQRMKCQLRKTRTIWWGIKFYLHWDSGFIKTRIFRLLSCFLEICLLHSLLSALPFHFPQNKHFSLSVPFQQKHVHFISWWIQSTSKTLWAQWLLMFAPYFYDPMNLSHYFLLFLFLSLSFSNLLSKVGSTKVKVKRIHDQESVTEKSN